MSLQKACMSISKRSQFRARTAIVGRGVPNKRLFSTSEMKIVEESALKAEENGLVARHGEGDGVVTLNVGGKEFITLRSTIQNNAVLLNRVQQAEANQEFYKGAVYIDRDPTYFNLILQHLRNRADMMHSYKSFTSMKKALAHAVPKKAQKVIFKKKDVLIQIPEKKDALRDLYVEARYFQIRELEALLCAMDWHTRFASLFGSGSSNPFYAASQAITALRSALVATSGVGIVIGTQNEELMENFKGLFRDVFAVAKGKPVEDKAKEQQSKTEEPKSLSSGGIFSFS